MEAAQSQQRHHQQQQQQQRPALDPEVDEIPENPLRTYVKLISAQDDEFIVDRECAVISGTIRAILASPANWIETAQAMPTIKLESIDSTVLEKIIQYWYYKRRYDKTVPPVPPFSIDKDMTIRLIEAADFLDT